MPNFIEKIKNRIKSLISQPQATIPLQKPMDIRIDTKAGAEVGVVRSPSSVMTSSAIRPEFMTSGTIKGIGAGGTLIIEKDMTQIPQVKLPEPKIEPPRVVSGGVVDINKVSTPVETSAGVLTRKEIEDLINQKIVEKVPLVMTTPMPPPPAEIATEKDAVSKWREVLDKYGVNDKIKKLETLSNTITAAYEAFDEVISDFQKSPAMRETFKNKIMNYLIEGRNKNIQALTAQYNALRNALDASLDAARQEFGIFEKEATKRQTTEERLRDDTRQLLQQYISTGALADLPDEDLVSFASNLGINVNLLKGLRRAVKTGNEQKIAKAQADLEKTLQSMDIARQRLELAQEKAASVKNKDLVNLIAQIPTYQSRNEALEDLNRYREVIINKVGEDGYNKLLEEVDRLFPLTKSIERVQGSQNSGVFGAVKGFFSRLFQR